MQELFDNRYKFVQDLGNGGFGKVFLAKEEKSNHCLLYTSPSPRDRTRSRMPSSA